MELKSKEFVMKRLKDQIGSNMTSVKAQWKCEKNSEQKEGTSD